MAAEKYGFVVAAQDKCACLFAAVWVLLHAFKYAPDCKAEYKLAGDNHKAHHQREPVVEGEVYLPLYVCVVENKDENKTGERPSLRTPPILPAKNKSCRKILRENENSLN